jgi:peptide-methionine (S)-S-oxide reductase
MIDESREDAAPAAAPAAPPAALETATLGGGCFWCLEAVFVEFEGVHGVRSGYAGGHTPNPTYREVCGKRTGHAEVVQVTFDPAVLPYAELLRIFFTIHDPTTPDRQGADRGPQYRSIILCHTAAQEAQAREVMAEVAEAGWWGSPPLVTEVVAAGAFYPAEAEHHRYYARNPSAPYCQFVVEPKVVKARTSFAHRLRQP